MFEAVLSDAADVLKMAEFLDNNRGPGVADARIKALRWRAKAFLKMKQFDKAGEDVAAAKAIAVGVFSKYAPELRQLELEVQLAREDALALQIASSATRPEEDLSSLEGPKLIARLTELAVTIEDKALGALIRDRGLLGKLSAVVAQPSLRRAGLAMLALCAGDRLAADEICRAGVWESVDAAWGSSDQLALSFLLEALTQHGLM
jgi:hypothetical protein